jgi:hypothetical protein
VQYLYILVRDDLAPEDTAAQAVHASIEATRGYRGEHPHVVLCAVEDIERENVRLHIHSTNLIWVGG